MPVAINQPELWRDNLPWPNAQSHKHNRGRLGVVFGGWADPVSRGFGAQRLAARAGQRLGAGWVCVLAPEPALPFLVAEPASWVVRVQPDPQDLGAAVAGWDAAVFGPNAGVAGATRAAAEILAATSPRLVLDADALTAFAANPDPLWDLLGRTAAVITPHEGEFARLFPHLDATTPRSERAIQAAQISQAIIVLKGAETIIASPAGDVRANRNASPWLASAGTGDVLAGMIGGLLAGGMSPMDAASAACWLHAEAARRIGPGLIADDLVTEIGVALNQLAPPPLQAD